MVLLLYADSAVHDLHLKEVREGLLANANLDSDVAFFGELEGIRLDVQQDLHDSLLVRADNRADQAGRDLAARLGEACELCVELDPALVCAQLLN